jgi:hypothetical protein
MIASSGLTGVKPLILVVLESPYALDGQIERNVAYARAAVRDSVTNYGESPIASHLLFTQIGILDDTIPEQRHLGLSAGFAWIPVCHRLVAYVDFGISAGMQQGINLALEFNKPVVMRRISFAWPVTSGAVKRKKKKA